MDIKESNNVNMYLENTRTHWSKTPCGSNYSQKEYLSKEYFDEIENHRYNSHPWILENIEKFDVVGKKVLEIGFGMGTDHLALASQGAIMHGIDLTPGNKEITNKRFDLYGLSSDLCIGDGQFLPYEDNSIDFVYSFGVIHHSPNTEKVIAEIFRVLKPGGRVWVTVYHKKSIFFLWSIYLYDWLLCRGYKRETLKERISRVEYPNNSPDLIVRLFTTREIRNMFIAENFCKVNVSVDHLIKADIAVFGKYIPQKILDFLGKRFGWYVIIDAAK